jgi:hypothetical protein
MPKDDDLSGLPQQGNGHQHKQKEVEERLHAITYMQKRSREAMAN